MIKSLSSQNPPPEKNQKAYITFSTTHKTWLVKIIMSRKQTCLNLAWAKKEKWEVKRIYFTLRVLVSKGWKQFFRPSIPSSWAILFFTASDFTSITSHIHNWMLFLLWLCLFILPGVISPLISSSILGRSGSIHLLVSYFFYIFILFMGFSRQEYWSGLPVHKLVENISGWHHTSLVSLSQDKSR